jgi:hypothetical protein
VVTGSGRAVKEVPWLAVGAEHGQHDDKNAPSARPMSSALAQPRLTMAGSRLAIHSSVTAATSRQPASMVRECPRPSICL